MSAESETPPVDSAPNVLGGIVLLDACVLYPGSLRDLFVTLAVSGLYLPKWTEAIHSEWIENLLEQDAARNDPPRLERSRLERTRDQMERACPRSQVTGYEPRVECLTLPDADDRHVLAAALESEAAFLVTFNLRHFPASILTPLEVQALHPDVFLCALFDQAPEVFEEALRQILSRLNHPPRSWQEQVAVLHANGLPRLAQRLSRTDLTVEEI